MVCTEYCCTGILQCTVVAPIRPTHIEEMPMYGNPVIHAASLHVQIQFAYNSMLCAASGSIHGTSTTP